MKYLTHYLDFLILPATWDGLLDIMICSIVSLYKVKVCLILMSREIFQRTHTVMNNNC